MGEIDFAALAAPFRPDQVHWRVGSTTKDKRRGLALAYLDARDVMDRLDKVCGPARWSDHYAFDGARTLCTLTIMLPTGSVCKVDGAGDTDIEGEKGGLSDAFKRAAVKWGVGRYLYRCESPWVELEDGKRIKKGQEAKLAKALGGVGVPSEAQPPPDLPREAGGGSGAGEIESGDGPPDRISPERAAEIRKAIGPRCRDLGIKPQEYGPIIEVAVARAMGFASFEDAPADLDFAFLEAIGKWVPGDEGEEDIPF